MKQDRLGSLMRRAFGPTLTLSAFAALVPLLAGGATLVAQSATQAPARLSRRSKRARSLPGGAATSRESVTDRDAFSHFSNSIGFEGQVEVQRRQRHLPKALGGRAVVHESIGRAWDRSIMRAAARIAI